MSGSVNKVVLIGNLGHDPSIKAFNGGGRVCNLSIATSESWRDKDTGERKERVQWHKVVILNEGLIKIAESYLKKGAKVFIEGQLETRKYTGRDNIEKYATEIVLRPYRGELQMLDSRSGGENPYADNSQSDYQTDASEGLSATALGPAGVDDEIPF